MKRISIFLALFAVIGATYGQQKMKAYYTKVEKGQAWEELSRTKEHADIVINVAGGQLVFWRGYSFLPYWEINGNSWKFREVIARSGDGPEYRPDNTNSFSFVRIIESNKENTVIHWRYLPVFGMGNPKKNVNHLSFVDEYFDISASGQIQRTIKQGTANVDDWINDRNVIVQKLALTADGIDEIETKKQSGGQASDKIDGNPIVGATVVQPSLEFKFDEGIGLKSLEKVSNQKIDILGHKSYWKKGVSGTALAFDSYTTKLEVANPDLQLSNFTVESWLAMRAYPFNWAPILQQSEFEKSGFYLGVGPTGKMALNFSVKGKWKTLVSDAKLSLNKWVHVAATFDGLKATIYVDGVAIGSLKVKGTLDQSNRPFVVGFNDHEQIPGDPVRPDCHHCHTPTAFGIDGIIDELKVYNSALSSEQVKKSYTSFNPGEQIVNAPDLKERVLPMGPTSNQFKAHYTGLKYYDTWDNLSRFGEHADVVVEFDELPTKFIFWRGMSYVPQVVNAENQWYNNQFNESWDAGGSWGEPMSDKKSMRSHVRVIEDTPARKVIHWRYAQVQIDGTQQNYNDKTGWGDWSDWYYYIYPDGVACKRMVHWSSDNPLSHEWQESIGVMGPNQTPESISEVYDKTVTLDDMKETGSYDWGDLHKEYMIPFELEEKWDGTPLNIQIVNYKSDYDPFTIGDFKSGECYGDFDGRIAPYSQLVVYIHWPLGQLPTDGTRAFQPDRASSNGYTHLVFEGSNQKGKHWAERVMLEGMANKTTEELRPLTKSWLMAPELKNLTGAEDGAYDKAQRAYQFDLDSEATQVSFDIDASDKSPIENLCFVVKHWDEKSNAELLVNGSKIEDERIFRQGTFTDVDGTTTLVVYLKHSSEDGVNIKVNKVSNI